MSDKSWEPGIFWKTWKTHSFTHSRHAEQLLFSCRNQREKLPQSTGVSMAHLCSPRNKHFLPVCIGVHFEHQCKKWMQKLHFSLNVGNVKGPSGPFFQKAKHGRKRSLFPWHEWACLDTCKSQTLSNSACHYYPIWESFRVVILPYMGVSS